MYIQTREMRDEFIAGLSVNFPYAGALPTKSLANPSDILFAASYLYAYGTPFWTRGGQTHLNSQDIPLINNLLNNFAQKIHNYFHTNPPASQAEFNIFHKRLCRYFLDECSHAGYTHTEGNAQKMVNVLFKYLACFNDAAKYEEWFKYCHMALDGFTYNGYRLPFYRDVVYPTIHNCRAPALASWSKMSYTAYSDATDDIISYISSHPKTYNEYLNICGCFPVLSSIARLPDDGDFILTPFEAEFFLWIIAKACAERNDTKNFVYSMEFIRSIKELL